MTLFSVQILFLLSILPVRFGMLNSQRSEKPSPSENTVGTDRTPHARLEQQRKCNILIFEYWIVKFPIPMSVYVHHTVHMTLNIALAAKSQLWLMYKKFPENLYFSVACTR